MPPPITLSVTDCPPDAGRSRHTPTTETTNPTNATNNPSTLAHLSASSNPTTTRYTANPTSAAPATTPPTHACVFAVIPPSSDRDPRRGAHSGRR
ncbi:hypothetical protein B4N89_46785 [Embleya scabrispora]|uniref:Uncharacterized protein n=2 Tax=Embleya scabrispora TaxID=159449 RepID=A0A1T3NI64_9ACTN|nr:hypothetical protein B4N89_46785 [Embleya scabrispora]